MPMVISEVHFREIAWEPNWRHPVMLDQLPLGITPESLQAVTRHATPAKPGAMVDGEMPIPAKGHGIIATEFVGVDQRPSLDHLDRFLQQRFHTHISDHGDRHTPSLL